MVKIEFSDDEIEKVISGLYALQVNMSPMVWDDIQEVIDNINTQVKEQCQ